MELITALLMKHFICDFPLQMTPWMYKNKGTYGHVGGLAHSLVHVIGSLIVLFLLAPSFIWLALVDGVIHYHIDYSKLRIGSHFNLKPDNSEWFWVLLGVDQLLHQLTYIGMVYIVSL